jgi:hypothetical protein
MAVEHLESRAIHGDGRIGNVWYVGAASMRGTSLWRTFLLVTARGALRAESFCEAIRPADPRHWAYVTQLEGPENENVDRFIFAISGGPGKIDPVAELTAIIPVIEQYCVQDRLCDEPVTPAATSAWVISPSEGSAEYLGEEKLPMEGGVYATMAVRLFPVTQKGTTYELLGAALSRAVQEWKGADLEPDDLVHFGEGLVIVRLFVRRYVKNPYGLLLSFAKRVKRFVEDERLP